MAGDSSSDTTTDLPAESLFQYSTPRRSRHIGLQSPTHDAYARTPLSRHTQQLFQTPRKSLRPVESVPIKVLDAPDIQKDFYLQLLDWSCYDILSVALANSVYLYSCNSSSVSRLVRHPQEGIVTSLRYMQRVRLLYLV
jgi:cell division cycle 20-like protein 1 (cofactor of APC complex)